MIDFKEWAYGVLTGVFVHDKLETARNERVAQALREAYEQGRRDENEACASACENVYSADGHAPGDWPTPEQCAEAIRARTPNALMSQVTK